MLKTQAGFRKFSSINPFAFNADAEAGLPSRGISVFEMALHDRAEGYFNTACEQIEASVYSPLCEVMIQNKCNKPTAHNYTRYYHQLLQTQRESAMTFVEIGIGTPNQEVPSAMAASYPFGSSLRGWRDYLQNEGTWVTGGDIDPRVLIQEYRIRTGYINQLNPTAILAFVKQFNLDNDGIDFFLDDGLHEYRSNLTLLLGIWPYIKRNGLYLIEDIAESTFNSLCNLIPNLCLGANGVGIELPSPLKSDNRIIVLQKN